MTETPPPASFRTPPAHETRRVRIAGASADWGVAAEVAVEINLNGAPIAVMMATPEHVDDLAVGFALSEGLVDANAAVQTVVIQALPEGLIADVRLEATAVRAERVRPRYLEGRSGCGLCGVETLADAIRDVRPVAAVTDVSDEAVLRAFAELGSHQPLNAVTRSVHAAAWCAPDGAVRFAREDVGRHNALDKLIGARSRAPAESGFVVMSSRCSFELVQKCAMAGIGALATVSAPTTLALDLARAAGVCVLAKAGDAVARFPEDDDA